MRGRLPRFAVVPALADQGFAADLDRVMTVEKAVIARWNRTAGCRTDAESRGFALTLARKRVRTAFPDDFVDLVQPLQRRLIQKHDKGSDEGRALRSLREIRVRAAPAWDADAVELTFFFVREPSAHDFEGSTWEGLLENWLSRLKVRGRFTTVDGLVQTLDDLTARDYVESDLLDLGFLSHRPEWVPSAAHGRTALSAALGRSAWREEERGQRWVIDVASFAVASRLGGRACATGRLPLCRAAVPNPEESMNRPSTAVLALLLASCTAPTSQSADPLSHRFLVAPSPGAELDDPSWDPDVEFQATLASIQLAIDAASPGDTVTVPPGVYIEDITMAPGVTVDGAGRAETYIVGTVTFDSTSDTDSVLKDVAVYSASYYSTGVAYLDQGVVFDGGQGKLMDSAVYYTERGVLAQSASNVYVESVLLAYNWYGVGIDTSTNVTVANSLVGANPAGGIYALGASSGQIIHNTLVGNAFGGTESYLTGAVSVGDGVAMQVHNNVITSNYYGLYCYACAGDWSGNDIWGNTTDYVGDASADSADISLDPLFEDAANGDYRLSASSPAIDAGTDTYTIVTDYYDNARPQGDGVDIGFHEYASSSYRLVISEVMANAATEDTGEFVEVYNAGARPVDLAGFVLTDGDDVDTLQAFGGGSTVLPAGAYAVILDADYADDYSIPADTVLLTVGDTRLGNGFTTSDEVTLYETDGSTIAASFSYPTDPGDGVSMEAYDLETGDAAGNWRPSVCASGSSPGAAHCFPESGDPSVLIITEVLANAADDNTGEYVELYNPTDTEIDASGLVIADGGGYSDTLTGFQGGSTIIGAHEHAVILDGQYTYQYFLPAGVTLLSAGTTIGNGLSNSSDTVTLYAADGSTLIDSFSFPGDTSDGISHEKVDYTAGDVETNWVDGDASCTRGRTPGRLNGAAGGVCSPLVITEVMANPLDEATGEFVEIWNVGGDDIDLAGLVISDGDQDDTIAAFDSGSTVLAAGSRAIVVDDGYAGEYALDSSVVVVSSGDANLGNGLSTADAVSLYDTDGQSLIDAFQFPFNPGNGTSAEKVDEGNYAGIDDSDNWTASTCASGSSPGVENCAASGSSSIVDSDLELVISEVMSNPLDEGTGEFIELYNAGTTDIDLLYMAVYDGDALDTILGWTDPYDTVLGAGEYAVVLDADYAGEYSIPAGVLVVTTDDSTIGSGLATNDEVYLFESDVSSLIDSYTHPFNPGNGVSVEKVDLAGGDTEDNWTASSCGSSPGETNCL